MIRDAAGLLLYTLGPGTLGRMPRAALLPFSRVLAGGLRRASPSDVRQMRAELEALAGNRDDSAIRAAWRVRVLAELEVLGYRRLASHVDEVVQLRGRQNLDAALERGRGAMVVIGHFGANQLVMPALGHRGYAVHQLSADPSAWAEIRTDRVNPLWRLVQRRKGALERSLPAHHIDIFRFLRPAFAALAANGVLCVAFDGGMGRRFVPVTIGRRAAHVPLEPWRLAQKTGATVVPAVVLAPSSGGHCHEVLLGDGYLVDDPVAAARRFASWFSAYVLAHPDHYLPFTLFREKVRASDACPLFDTPALPG